MNAFERYLTLWVALCIAAGIAFGQMLPDLVQTIGGLEVATAISLFGFTSGAALATVVGVVFEVPVMLSVVKIVNATKPWYERGGRVRRVAAGQGAGEPGENRPHPQHWQTPPMVETSAVFRLT